MLREEERKDVSIDISQANSNDFVFYVGNEPVMQIAVDLIPKIGKTEKLILKAKGHSIPNAVAVANILTEKMLKGNSKIQKILLDSEIPEGMGRMLSTIEIIISKN
ncbi:MAG: DNA-binding protein [Nitrosopumilaceae archaeon]